MNFRNYFRVFFLWLLVMGIIYPAFAGSTNSNSNNKKSNGENENPFASAIEQFTSVFDYETPFANMTQQHVHTGIDKGKHITVDSTTKAILSFETLGVLENTLLRVRIFNNAPDDPEDKNKPRIEGVRFATQDNVMDYMIDINPPDKGVKQLTNKNLAQVWHAAPVDGGTYGIEDTGFGFGLSETGKGDTRPLPGEIGEYFFKFIDAPFTYLSFTVNQRLAPATTDKDGRAVWAVKWDRNINLPIISPLPPDFALTFTVLSNSSSQNNVSADGLWGGLGPNSTVIPELPQGALGLFGLFMGGLVLFIRQRKSIG